VISKFVIHLPLACLDGGGGRCDGGGAVGAGPVMPAPPLPGPPAAAAGCGTATHDTAAIAAIALVRRQHAANGDRLDLIRGTYVIDTSSPSACLGLHHAGGLARTEAAGISPV
jgi:hypothetical protein